MRARCPAGVRKPRAVGASQPREGAQRYVHARVRSRPKGNPDHSRGAREEQLGHA